MIKALEPIKLRNIELKNRIVRSATQDPYGRSDGTISEWQIELYKKLAENNIGLIIGAHSYVDPEGRANTIQNAIYDNGHIESHKRLTETVHKAGAKILSQISHAGSGALCPEVIQPVAPSPVPYMFSQVVPRELTVPEIEEITEKFVKAAVRSKKAGYDGIQIHCAHGYLLSSFVNPVKNVRKDEYGGGIENRFRITEDIIKRIIGELGASYPLFLKINSNIEENDEEYYKDLVYVAKKCKELGLNAIEYSGFNFTRLGKEGYNNYYKDRVSALREEVDIPAILVGGIRSFKDMDAVIGGGIDMVSLSRPFISEPNLVTKLISGKERAQCISCSKCFVLYQREGRRCVFHTAKDGPTEL